MRTALALIALLFTATLASAQPGPCADRELVVQRLGSEWGETLQTLGVSNAGVLEIYASEETGTWTILMSRPDGMTCMVAAGKNWDDLPADTQKGDPA